MHICTLHTHVNQRQIGIYIPKHLLVPKLFFFSPKRSSHTDQIYGINFFYLYVRTYFRTPMVSLVSNPVTQPSIDPTNRPTGPSTQPATHTYIQLIPHLNNQASDPNAPSCCSQCPMHLISQRTCIHKYIYTSTGIPSSKTYKPTSQLFFFLLKRPDPPRRMKIPMSSGEEEKQMARGWCREVLVAR